MSSARHAWFGRRRVVFILLAAMLIAAASLTASRTAATTTAESHRRALLAVDEQERALAEAGAPLCAGDVYGPLSEAAARDAVRLSALSRECEEWFRGDLAMFVDDDPASDYMRVDVEGARRDLARAGDLLDRVAAHVRSVEAIRMPELGGEGRRRLVEFALNATLLAEARCVLPETPDEVRFELAELLLSLSAKSRPANWSETLAAMTQTRSYACDILQGVLESGRTMPSEALRVRLDALLAEPIAPRYATVTALERALQLRYIRLEISGTAAPPEELGEFPCPRLVRDSNDFADALDEFVRVTHVLGRSATTDIARRADALAELESRRSGWAQLMERLGLRGKDPASTLLSGWSFTFPNVQGADAQAALARAALAIRRAAAYAPDPAAALVPEIERTADAGGVHLTWRGGCEKEFILARDVRWRRRLAWALAPAPPR